MFSKRGTSQAQVQAMIDAIPADIIIPPAISGRYYDVGTTTSTSSTSATAFAMSANRLYAVPIFLLPGTYTKLGVAVGTAAAASKILRCGIYDVGTDGLPGAKLLDPGADLAAGGEYGRLSATTTARIVTLHRDPGSYGLPSTFGTPAASLLQLPSVWMRL